MSNEYPQERYTFDVVSEGSQSDHQHLEEMEWEAEGTMSLMDTCTPRQRNRDFYKALSDARISSIIRKQEEKGAKCPPAPGGSESRGERIYRFVPFTFLVQANSILMLMFFFPIGSKMIMKNSGLHSNRAMCPNLGKRHGRQHHYLIGAKSHQHKFILHYREPSFVDISFASYGCYPETEMMIT